MFAGLMIGAERIDGIDQTKASFGLRHVGGRLRSLDRGQTLIRTVAPNPSGAFRALRQYFAERAFNLDDGVQREFGDVALPGGQLGH